MYQLASLLQHEFKLIEQNKVLADSTIRLILMIAMFDRFEVFHKVFLFFHFSVWIRQKIFSVLTLQSGDLKGQRDENELNKHQYVNITFETLCI